MRVKLFRRGKHVGNVTEDFHKPKKKQTKDVFKKLKLKRLF